MREPAARAQVFSKIVWILFIFEFFTGAGPGRQARGRPGSA